MPPPDPKSSAPRHRRDTRLLVAVALAFFFIWGGIYLSQEGGASLGAERFTSRLPLFILWYLDVILIAATLFVIFRALIKLLLERRRGVLGAKFKTKLLITQLGLTAIPIALLFLAATNLLQRTIDRWFSTPVETIVNRAEALRDVADRREADAAAREARALARALDRSPSQDPAALLADDLALRGFSSLEWHGDGAPVRLSAPGEPPAPDAPAAAVAQARAGTPAGWIDFGRDGSRWFRAAAGSARGVVIAGLRVSAADAAAGDFVARAWSDYRKMEVQKSAIKATNILVFTLLTLALLFAAIWTALTLARRITAPIGALAESTRRITQGDLTAEVDVAASDELGVLVESFNTMTAEIRENRRRLEQSNVDLTAINQRLDRERQLLSTVLETARTGIVAMDRHGRVQLANPAALEILGIDRAPERLEDLSSRADLAPLFETVASARSGMKPPPREFSAGSRRAEVSVAAMPGDGGESRGFVIALEDTTEVARAQRLEAWTEAARRVAHEIKNPLTPIKLSAERMVKKLKAGDPDASEAVRQGAQVIIEEVDLLKSLVDQFARFARLPELKPAPTDLTALVEKTVALYREAKDGVDLAFDNRLPRHPYRLDGEQVQRVLVNLLDNALEACEPGGRVVLALSEEAGVLTIQVSDTGSGIGAEDREKIFLPDFSTKPGGSGLGLAIVSRIVADHRGTIRWEENRPRGSRFIIEIPAA
jgi:two-component system nitrogen regulation sensor histidine kinase NtrY